MLGFMDLGWPRVCRRSTAVLYALWFYNTFQEDLATNHLLRYDVPDDQVALRVDYYKRENIIYYIGLWKNASVFEVTLPFLASIRVCVRRLGPEVKDPEETLELEKIRAMEESMYKSINLSQ